MLCWARRMLQMLLVQALGWVYTASAKAPLVLQRYQQQRGQRLFCSSRLQRQLLRVLTAQAGVCQQQGALQAVVLLLLRLVDSTSSGCSRGPAAAVGARHLRPHRLLLQGLMQQ